MENLTQAKNDYETIKEKQRERLEEKKRLENKRNELNSEFTFFKSKDVHFQQSMLELELEWKNAATSPCEHFVAENGYQGEILKITQKLNEVRNEIQMNDSKLQICKTNIVLVEKSLQTVSCTLSEGENWLENHRQGIETMEREQAMQLSSTLGQPNEPNKQDQSSTEFEQWASLSQKARVNEELTQNFLKLQTENNDLRNLYNNLKEENEKKSNKADSEINELRERNSNLMIENNNSINKINSFSDQLQQKVRLVRELENKLTDKQKKQLNDNTQDSKQITILQNQIKEQDSKISTLTTQQTTSNDMSSAQKAEIVQLTSKCNELMEEIELARKENEEFRKAVFKLSSSQSSNTVGPFPLPQDLIKDFRNVGNDILNFEYEDARTISYSCCKEAVAFKEGIENNLNASFTKNLNIGLREDPGIKSFIERTLQLKCSTISPPLSAITNIKLKNPAKGDPVIIEKFLAIIWKILLSPQLQIFWCADYDKFDPKQHELVDDKGEYVLPIYPGIRRPQSNEVLVRCQGTAQHQKLEPTIELYQTLQNYYL